MYMNLQEKRRLRIHFFHIFNHLHQSGKQLILTCDKPPVELQGMEQRLCQVLNGDFRLIFKDLIMKPDWLFLKKSL
jgi:hypothetical protein